MLIHPLFPLYVTSNHFTVIIPILTSIVPSTFKTLPLGMRVICWFCPQLGCGQSLATVPGVMIVTMSPCLFVLAWESVTINGKIAKRHSSTRKWLKTFTFRLLSKSLFWIMQLYGRSDPARSLKNQYFSACDE